jgi:hypothetical protein
MYSMAIVVAIRPKQQLENGDPYELYGSANTNTESILTYVKPSEATFSMFDFAPVGCSRPSKK